jgi:cell wall-associated NlpC family hydrolase
MKSKELIEYAKKFLGIPYKFGGTSPSTGFDCSGFVQYVYKNCLGINISRTTKEQINDGFEVKKEDLLPGDLVFPNNHHVTLYIGNNQVIHAPQPNDHIKISKLWSF